MMRRIITLGLAVLFWGSCGVMPQLTVKSRRYQRGMFVKLNWDKRKGDILKYRQQMGVPEELSLLRTNTVLIDWWQMQREATVELSEIRVTQQENQMAESQQMDNEISNLNVQYNPFHVEKDKLTKFNNRKTFSEFAIKPTAEGDQTLSLLSFIMGVGGFLLFLISFATPYLVFLSLLAFIAGLILGIIALSKEGGNALAIIGVVLSSIGCLLWGVLGLLLGAILLTV